MQGWGRGTHQSNKRNLKKKVNIIGLNEDGQQQRRAIREYRLSLEKDVAQLQKKLRQEIDTHKALERAFRRTLGVLPRISPGLAPKIQKLLAEVAVLEEEVINLEESIVSLRQGLYNEAVYLSASKHEKESSINPDNLCPKLPLQVQHMQNGIKGKRNSVIAKLLPPVIDNQTEQLYVGVEKLNDGELKKSATHSIGSEKPSFEMGSGYAVKSAHYQSSECEVATPRVILSYQNITMLDQGMGLDKENEQRAGGKLDSQSSTTNVDTVRNVPTLLKVGNADAGHVMDPNLLSEEMVYCLSSIFLKLAKPGPCVDTEMSSTMLHSTFSSAWRFNSTNSVSYNTSSGLTEDIDCLDPYGICRYSTSRDVGPYRYYQQVLTDSLDYTKIPRSASLLKRLMGLVEKLSIVDLQGLTHQQKLAFWINTYNVCMMHAFLEHGIPNSPHKVVALMGKAGINVGGHYLSALAIEHFILRLPSDPDNVEWKQRGRETEGLMCGTYGLEWPEPLVTFALCCGSWSSPAVRVYTPAEVENELEIAKTEYLQAAVGVTPAKVVIPKLLDWYMRDFAKDAESLLDWIADQLPSSLSKSIQRCLAEKQSKAILEAVGVMPYDFSFRYLFAMQPV